nr:polysaccharide biosynthesis tyrosine autokinase [Armatimonas sp.]
MSKDEEERKRLERFRRGEPGAFDDLYEVYGPRLYLFGLRLSGKPADAEDLKQDVFVAAYRSLHRFEGRSSLTTYLYKIALYRWGQLRDTSRPELVGWDETQEVSVVTPDPSSQSHTRLELRAALEALSDAQRAAFLLVKADGFTCAEAAQMLDIPVGTVKYQVHEALRHLRLQLGDKEVAQRKETPPMVVKEVVKTTMDNSEIFADFEETERVLGVPALGSIPLISEPGFRLFGVSKFSPLMESYRSLRTHLRFRKDTPLRTLVIASSVPAEGKSTVVANLAMAMAMEKKRVILVDADLRRPMQHKLFAMNSSPGLSDVLAGTHSLEQVLRPTSVAGVSLITAGSPPPTPTELLGSEAMETLLEELKQRSDIVLIDSAPVLAVSDTCTFAHATDGVLLVIGAGETKKALVQRTMTLLGRCRAQVLGTVLNRVPMPTSYYYTKYYVPTEELAVPVSSKENQLSQDTTVAPERVRHSSTRRKRTGQ